MSEHTRTSTEGGPDFCAECSAAAHEWVAWPCVASSRLMDPASEAAAFWGTAENRAYPVADRLACALAALDFYGAAYEALEDVGGAAGVWEEAEKVGERYERSRWLWSAGVVSRAVNGLDPDVPPERPANPYQDSQAGGCAGAPSTAAESSETGPPSRSGSGSDLPLATVGAVIHKATDGLGLITSVCAGGGYNLAEKWENVTCSECLRERPVAPVGGVLKTQEEKVAFRKAWDARVDAGKNPEVE